MKTKKPKIIIIIPLWQRAKVFKVVSNQLEVFCAANARKIDFMVLFVLSPEDLELKKHLRIIKKAEYAHEIILHPNIPVGNKLNEGFKRAVNMGCDYIMNFGSDDLAHPALMKLYMPLIKQEIPLFGLNKIYFWNVDGTAFHFSSYNNPHIIGAGRMIHISVVKKVIHRYGCLYESYINRGLDGSSGLRMMSCLYKQEIIDAGMFPMVVDIKSEVNINSFEKIKESHNSNGIAYIEEGYLEKIFPGLKKIRIKSK